MEFIEKNMLSYLIFEGGLFIGQAERIGNDWVFHPRNGLPGPRYSFGRCPLDAVEQWQARGGTMHGN